MKKHKILIIDDEEQILDVMGTYLSRKGFDVEQARAAEEGLEILGREKGIDLVILDEKMPGMSGTEFIKTLREEEKGLPVIVLTGSVGLSTLEHVRKHYSKHVLYKPIRLSELTSLAKRIISSGAKK
ncbi:MAG: response regulator [Candidatus Omnitrophica bacterium]|nr:response regulator [Candidatus Omnitrophota bacterium]